MRINNNAFFPAKLQPLHLGHIITICRIKEMGYHQIEICLTHDIPHINTPEENAGILRRIFDHDCETGRIIITIIDNTLLDHVKLHRYPEDWDVLSGNQDVLKWAETYGYNPVYLPRTEGVGYSGTEIRKLYNL